jgi:hypothetical protein
MISLSKYFQFGKKDERLFNQIVDTCMNIDDFDINERNNILSRIRLSLRKNRSVYNE